MSPEELFDIDVLLQDIQEFREFVSQASPSYLDLLIGHYVSALLVDLKSSVVLHATPAAAHTLGYTTREMESMSVHLFVPLDKREQHKADFGEYSEAPHRQQMGRSGRDVLGLCKNGTTVPLHVRLEVAEVSSLRVAIVYMMKVGD